MITLPKGFAPNPVQDRAAMRELIELRADTVRGLVFTFGQEGESGIVRLLIEAGIVAESASALRKVKAA